MRVDKFGGVVVVSVFCFLVLSTPVKAEVSDTGNYGVCKLLYDSRPIDLKTMYVCRDTFVTEDIDSESAKECNLYYGSCVKVLNYSSSDQRVFVVGDTGEGYVDKQFLVDDIECASFNAPCTSGFKSYMSFNSLSEDSPQGRLESRSSTGNERIREYQGRYLVAMGSKYGMVVGQYFDLELDNGEVIHCVMGDGKADKDTDGSNVITVSNGCMSEFIVDIDKLSEEVQSRGDISYANDGWTSPVSKVIVYDKVV